MPFATGIVLLNMLVKELDAMGLRDIGIASSSVHPVHAEIIPYIRKGVITRIETGVNGLIARNGQQGRTGLPHSGAQPWRAGPVAGHRRGRGRCRLHCRAHAAISPAT